VRLVDVVPDPPLGRVIEAGWTLGQIDKHPDASRMTTPSGLSSS
jgi:hypothetical protein